MTPAEARKEITSRFLLNFSGQFGIAIDNKRFESTSYPWVRLNVLFNTGNQDTLGKSGNRKFVSKGLVIIQVFTEANQGTNENDTVAAACQTFLDGERFGVLHLYNGRIVTVGNDGADYQQNVIVEFEFETIR